MAAEFLNGSGLFQTQILQTSLESSTIPPGRSMEALLFKLQFVFTMKSYKFEILFCHKAEKWHNNFNIDNMYKKVIIKWFY